MSDAARLAAQRGFFSSDMKRVHHFSLAPGLTLGFLFLVVPTHADVTPFVEDALDLYMRSTMVMTIGEVKPFTLQSETGKIYEALVQKHGSAIRKGESLKLIESVFKEGTLSNPDLKMVLHKVWPSSGESERALTVINRKAVARLLDDPEAMDALDAVHADIPNTVDEWIALYFKAVEANGYQYTGPRWANVVIGISLGFPPKEVMAYADQRLTGKRPLKILPVIGMIDGYARFTSENLEWDEHYVRSAKTLLGTYRRLRQQGLRPEEIFNRPQALINGVACPRALWRGRT